MTHPGEDIHSNDSSGPHIVTATITPHDAGTSSSILRQTILHHWWWLALPVIAGMAAAALWDTRLVYLSLLWLLCVVPCITLIAYYGRALTAGHILLSQPHCYSIGSNTITLCNLPAEGVAKLEIELPIEKLAAVTMSPEDITLKFNNCDPPIVNIPIKAIPTAYRQTLLNILEHGTTPHSHK